MRQAGPFRVRAAGRQQIRRFWCHVSGWFAAMGTSQGAYVASGPVEDMAADDNEGWRS
jgi:hypothetical protein